MSEKISVNGFLNKAERNIYIKQNMIGKEDLYTPICQLIFTELYPKQVAKLKLFVDDYIDELLTSQTEEDEKEMLQIINREYP